MKLIFMSRPKCWACRQVACRQRQHPVRLCDTYHVVVGFITQHFALHDKEWLLDEINIYEPSEMLGDGHLLDFVTSRMSPVGRRAPN
jgi:hypothetical protein